MTWSIEGSSYAALFARGHALLESGKEARVHVVVIGGGVMGCASAHALATLGASVTLLERAVPGAEASSAAAGILGAQVESLEHPEQRAMLVKARAGYAAWAEVLRAETGIGVGYRVSGVLRVATSAAELAGLATHVETQRKEGLRAELLDTQGALEAEPELHPEITGAAYFEDDAQVDPPLLLRALVAAIARANVRIVSGALVHRVNVERDRCTGVVLDDGTLRADATILAAGSWSKLVPGVPEAVPEVKPARGQMLLLEERPPRLRTILFGAPSPRAGAGDAKGSGGYVVPRGDGRVLCGSTLELVGFRKEVTAGGLHSILGTALALAPGLGAAAVTSFWSNFRPFTVNGSPLMGPSPLPGLFLATGHHRNGILLAKLTADAVADAVLQAL
jgi:glycine oxidase